MIEKIFKTEQEWKKILTPEQYRVLREKGTEAPYSCAWRKKDLGKGVFHCAACDLPLFASDTKFESGTGWPSYFESVYRDNIIEHKDNTLGMKRTEVLCARCDSHLGHVFDDPPSVGKRQRVEAGGPPPTGKRYCINSVSLNFKPDESK